MRERSGSARRARCEPLLDARPTRRRGGGGLLLAERALVEPELEQEVERLADDAAGRDAEVLHDLVAVEVGTDGLELLLLRSSAIRASSSSMRSASVCGLALVAGRAVAPGELDQLVEQRSPASRTKRRTALSVHPMAYVWKRRCR